MLTTSIIQGSKAEKNFSSRNITINAATKIATALYYQNEKPALFRVLRHFKPELKKYIYLQADITRNLRNGFKLSSSFNPISIPNRCELELQLKAEKDRINVEVAKYNLASSPEIKDKVIRYFVINNNDYKITIDLKIFILITYFRPQFQYESKKEILQDIKNGTYHGEFTTKEMQNGYIYDVDTYFIKRTCSNDANEVLNELNELGEFGRELYTIVDHTLAKNDFNLLLNNMILVSEIDLYAFTRENSISDVCVNNFVSFDIIEGKVNYDVDKEIQHATLRKIKRANTLM